MPARLQSPDKQQPLELTTDFLGESRHEFVAKVAYKLWEKIGQPEGRVETRAHRLRDRAGIVPVTFENCTPDRK